MTKKPLQDRKSKNGTSWSGTRTEVTQEGLYYLLILGFVLAGAVMRDINLMMLIAGALIGLLLYSWRAAVVALKGVELCRHAPEVVHEGENLFVEVEVANKSKRTAKRSLQIHDPWTCLSHSEVPPLAAHLFVSLVGEGETVRSSYEGVVRQRGEYELGPLLVECRHPFGLLARRRIVNDTARVTILPRLGQLLPAWKRLHRDALAGSRQPRRQQNLAEGDFFGLRDWRAGDSHRWIHWRTSARRDQLVVRQFDRQERLDLLLILDAWQSTDPNDEELELVERAISLAATIVSDASRGGGRLELLVLGEQPHFYRGEASRGRGTQLLCQLARFAAGSAPLDVQGIEQALVQSSPGSLVVTITTRPEEDINSVGILQTAYHGQRRSLLINCRSGDHQQYCQWAADWAVVDEGDTGVDPPTTRHDSGELMGAAS